MAHKTIDMKHISNSNYRFDKVMLEKAKKEAKASYYRYKRWSKLPKKEQLKTLPCVSGCFLSDCTVYYKSDNLTTFDGFKIIIKKTREQYKL